MEGSTVMTKKLNKAPLVRFIHPEFGIVLKAEIYAHILLGINGLFAEHTSPAWNFIGGDIGAAVFGVIHLILALSTTYGIVRNTEVLKWSLLISVSIYTMTMVMFGATVIYIGADTRRLSSLIGVGMGLFFLMISYAAFKGVVRYSKTKVVGLNE